jgi:hypothetical protein
MAISDDICLWHYGIIIYQENVYALRVGCVYSVAAGYLGHGMKDIQR